LQNGDYFKSEGCSRELSRRSLAINLERSHFWIYRGKSNLVNQSKFESIESFESTY
jgi:hypothetical protein